MTELETLPRQNVAFILNEIDGLPIHVQREKAYRWALDQGFTKSLVEELLFDRDNYASDLEEFRLAQKEAWAAKLKGDLEWEEKCRKDNRWDEAHHCEIPSANSTDPKDRRFRHNAGSDKSKDVTWHSNS